MIGGEQALSQELEWAALTLQTSWSWNQCFVMMIALTWYHSPFWTSAARLSGFYLHSWSSRNVNQQPSRVLPNMEGANSHTSVYSLCSDLTLPDTILCQPVVVCIVETWFAKRCSVLVVGDSCCGEGNLAACPTQNCGSRCPMSAPQHTSFWPFGRG